MKVIPGKERAHYIRYNVVLCIATLQLEIVRHNAKRGIQHQANNCCTNTYK